MKNISFIKTCLFIFGLGFIAFSCKKDAGNLPQPTDPTVVENISELATFFEDPNEESDRLSMIIESVVLKDTTIDKDHCTSYSAWTKVAEISTFPNDGQTMSATHISQVGNIVAVSYHLRGNEYLGIVEIWDISNPNDLKWKGNVQFEQADVNAIIIEADPDSDERFLWAALADKKKGAMLAELKIKSNNRFDKNYLRLSQLTKAVAGEASASANGVAEAKDLIYVTCGKSIGGVFAVDKVSLEVVGTTPFSDAKGVAANNFGKIAAIKTANGAAIFSGEDGDGELGSMRPIDPITHQNVANPQGGKVSAAFPQNLFSDILFVASGAEGIKGYDLNSNEQVYATPEFFLKNGNSNGIAFDEEYMYVANGADGIAIFPMFGEMPSISRAYLWDMDEPDASANYISSGNGWVVVAKGEGGVKLLKKASPGDKLPICDQNGDGVPNCLSNDVTVCSTLIDRLEAAMPIDAEVEIGHPEFFDGEHLGEILLTEDTKLKITFVEENTDLQNSIGYYFYHEDCPPASIEDLLGMVAFSNYSAVGSKGALQKGNTMKLPGTFAAGTRIGFFLIRSGFVGENEIYYSNNDFNAGGKTQSLLFYDTECGDVIGAFQGNPMPSTDADFRDATFKITPSNSDAINPGDYLRL